MRSPTQTRDRQQQATLDHRLGMTLLWIGPTLGFVIAFIYCCKAEG